MPRNLDFSQLLPERDTFTDEDGTVYEFKARVEFSPADIADLERIGKSLRMAMKRLRANPQDAHAQRQFEAVSIQMLTRIVPDLPKARTQAMSFGQRMAAIDWWHAANEERMAGAEDVEDLPDTGE